MAHSQLQCSFCGKPRDEVRTLITGPTSYICDECVGLFVLIFEDAQASVPALVELDQLPLIAFLREHMAGRPADSITVGELRSRIATVRDRLWPKPVVGPTPTVQHKGPEVPPSPGTIAEQDLTAFLSKQYGVPTIDLDSFQIDPEIIALIPRELACRHRVVPVNRAGTSLIVAMADPSNIYAIDDLKFVTNYNIEVLVASESAIGRAIEKYYPERTGEHPD